MNCHGGKNNVGRVCLKHLNVQQNKKKVESQKGNDQKYCFSHLELLKHKDNVSVSVLPNLFSTFFVNATIG